MSYVDGAVPTFAAAAVFAIGICFFWPTMLGFVSENIPESGALGLSVFGGAGMLSTSSEQALLELVRTADAEMNFLSFVRAGHCGRSWRNPKQP